MTKTLFVHFAISCTSSQKGQEAWPQGWAVPLTLERMRIAVVIILNYTTRAESQFFYL